MHYHVAERLCGVAFAGTAVSAIPVLASPSWLSALPPLVALASSVAAIVVVQVERHAANDRHKRVEEAQAQTRIAQERMAVAAIEQHIKVKESLAIIQVNQFELAGRIERLMDKDKPVDLGVKEGG